MPSLVRTRLTRPHSRLGAVSLAGLTAAALCLVQAPAALAAPGDFDSSFSQDGIAKQLGLESISAITSAPEGSTIGAGLRTTESGTDLAVIRLRPDGSLDLSFDGDGIAEVMPSQGLTPAGVAVDPQGGILVGGSSDSRFALARLTASGALDQSFAGDGIVELGSLSAAQELELTPDGGIVVAASALGVGSPPSARAAAVRLLANGQLDSSFGVGGVAVAGPAVQAGARTLALQDDGSVVLGTEDGVVRFTSSGAVDLSFGVQGVTAIPGSPVSLDSRAGRIFVGSAYALQGGPNAGATQPVLTQLSADGAATLPAPAQRGALFASTAQGELFVAGASSTLGLPTTFGISHLMTTGEADPSFGTDSRAPLLYRAAGYRATDVALSGQGQLVLALSPLDNSKSRRSLVARLNLGSGPPDADADGVRDRRDQCRLGYAKRRNGCNRARRTISLFEEHGRLFASVEASAACLTVARVSLYRKGPDSKQLIARVRDRSFARIPFKVNRGGRYFTTLRQGFSSLAQCSAAKSNVVAFR